MNYIQSFATYLRENGKAEKTIESYTGDVTGYIRYIGEKNITFAGQLNRFTINSYKNLLLENNYAPTTINKKLNSLQSINLYLIESGQMTDMVINLARDRIKIAKGSEKSVESRCHCGCPHVSSGNQCQITSEQSDDVIASLY